jgi:hypothetical protein
MRKRVGREAVLVVSVALFVAIGFFCQGAVTVSVLSVEKDVAPGEFVTHVFSIINNEALPEVYELEFDPPAGWGILGALSSIDLDPGEEGTLFITVTVPPGTLAGTYPLTLHVRSMSTPSEEGSASATTRVEPVNAVEILLPASQSVVPGETLSYEIGLVNRGNAQDTFEFIVSSAQQFPISLSSELVLLTPQERVTITVTFRVPMDARPGRDVLTVTATSTLYHGVSDEETLFTTILPPPPQAVGGSLMEELPVRLRLSIGQNVFTEAFTSSLTFSVSGGVLDGYFSSSLRLSPIFGPDPLEIGSFSILYRRTPATYTIGDTSKTFTDLLSLSCRGGKVEIDAETYQFAFLGGGRGDELRAGGRFVLGPTEANLGIAYLGRRSDVSEQAAWSLSAACVPLEDWSMRIEGALGLEDEKTSRAFFAATRIDTSTYFLNIEVFSVGTYFPGSRHDQAGIAFSQRLRHADFSFGASLSHDWDNVIGDPLAVTTITDDLGVNLSATPLEDGPTLTSTVEFTWKRNTDLTITDEIDRLLSVAMRQTYGVFPYSFSAKVNDQIDHVTTTAFRTLTFSEGVGLSIDDVDLFLTLTHEKRTDLMTGEMLFGGTDLSLRFSSRGSLHSATITLRNDEDDFDLSLSVNVEILDNLDLQLTGKFGWDRADATDTTFRWGTTFKWNFDLPIPFLVTKGRITGRVFVDEDGDGTFSEVDRGLGGVIVETGKIKVSTDADGTFRFPPFAPGEYSLDLSNLPLGAELTSPAHITLHAGQTARANLALVPVLIVSGTLFNDANKDGAFDNSEGGFSQVQIILTDPSGESSGAYTNLHGEFTFANVLPGSYTVSVDPTTLPERFTFTTPETIEIEVRSENLPSILIGGYIKPKQVVITFQPPTADFIYTPENPRVGELVLFDGSDSFDFDGEIISYEWDFDGDGKTDATGVTAHTSFAAVGPHDVTLTITDDTGNTDAITYTIDVK